MYANILLKRDRPAESAPRQDRAGNVKVRGV
jgi:hypothetical protein